MNSPAAGSGTAARLCDPAEIRLRCNEILDIGERGELPHFDVRTDRLPEVARIVADVTRKRYPDLEVPLHSRWRHFEAGGLDRWSGLARGLGTDERARVALDLLVPSVLLDAGAGDDWRYREERTGLVFARSEGLAVASFALFTSGGFSSDPERPLCTDADALRAFDSHRLAQAFPGRRGQSARGAGRPGRFAAFARGSDCRTAGNCSDVPRESVVSTIISARFRRHRAQLESWKPCSMRWAESGPDVSCGAASGSETSGTIEACVARTRRMNSFPFTSSSSG